MDLDNIVYKNKYLKYKNKYLDAKKQQGDINTTEPTISDTNSETGSAQDSDILKESRIKAYDENNNVQIYFIKQCLLQIFNKDTQNKSDINNINTIDEIHEYIKNNKDKINKFLSEDKTLKIDDKIDNIIKNLSIKFNELNPIHILYEKEEIKGKILYKSINSNDNRFLSYKYDNVSKFGEKVNVVLGSIITTSITIFSGFTYLANNTPTDFALGLGGLVSYSYKILPILLSTPLLFSGYSLYLRYMAVNEYSFVSSTILGQLMSILPDLIEIKMFYLFVENLQINDKDNKDTKDKYVSKIKEPYEITLLETQIYKILYLIVSNLEFTGALFIPGVEKPDIESISNFFNNYFDFINPKYIFDGTNYTENTKLNTTPKEPDYKLRYTTYNCTFCPINKTPDVTSCTRPQLYYNLNNFKNKNSTYTEKSCDNYNDLILRNLESKIKKITKDNNIEPNHRIMTKIKNKISNITSIGRNFTELIREYTILGMFYSLAMGKYNLHVNKLPSKINDFINKYNGMDKITNHMNEYKKILTSIEIKESEVPNTNNNNNQTKYEIKNNK